MKKILFIITILIVVVLLNKKEDTILTMNTTDVESNIVYLKIPNLTTKNITNYFDDDSDIIGLYPYVNPLYEKKIGNMFYTFNSNSLMSNINRFVDNYKNKLVNYNFTNDLVMVDYNGIKIITVKIYMNNEEIQEFLKKCKNCNYSLTK